MKNPQTPLGLQFLHVDLSGQINKVIFGPSKRKATSAFFGRFIWKSWFENIFHICGMDLA